MNQFISLTNQYINGEWLEGSSDKTGRIENPYNQELIAEVRYASREDVDKAYKVAKTAQKEWAKVPAEEKSNIMLKAADLFKQYTPEIGDILARDSGSSSVKAQFEIYTVVEALKEASTYPALMNVEKSVSSEFPDRENHIIHKPIGVVGVISPFNFPLFLSIRSIAPAIACGNAVVHKPDFQTGISGGVVIAKILEEAGLPKGIFNLVLTKSSVIGDELVENPIPSAISFTGSTEAGRHVGSLAGQHLKRVGLELGGNSPLIILEDADLEQSVKGAIFGKFIHQGQVCMIVNRIFVHRSLYKEFVEKFIAHAKTLPFGDPTDEKTVIGPIINGRQADKVMDIVKMAEEEGAKMALRGERIGNVITPFVFTDVKNKSHIAQNEIFGPIATIIPFDTEEEALSMANDTEYGLSASVWTKNLEHGLEVASKIESGMAHVNDQSVDTEAKMPFGGEKASGLGRFGGNWAFEEFTTVQWVSVQLKDKAFPF